MLKRPTLTAFVTTPLIEHHTGDRRDKARLQRGQVLSLVVYIAILYVGVGMSNSNDEPKSSMARDASRRDHICGSDGSRRMLK